MDILYEMNGDLDTYMLAQPIYKIYFVCWVAV